MVEDPTLYSTVEGSNPVAGKGREKWWKQLWINAITGKGTAPLRNSLPIMLTFLVHWNVSEHKKKMITTIKQSSLHGRVSEFTR